MTQLSEQTSRLVRNELLLAQMELKNSAKHAGVGAGLFGGGGVADGSDIFGDAYGRLLQQPEFATHGPS
nr:phage holin family protein [Dietzia lutea]